jgi:hypothetical protein
LAAKEVHETPIIKPGNVSRALSGLVAPVLNTKKISQKIHEKINKTYKWIVHVKIYNLVKLEMK